MSITEPISEFAPKRPRLVEAPPEAAIQSDEARLREIAGEMGYRLVPVADPPADPTDVQYVANSLNTLRYLDLKRVASEMLGTERRDEMTPAALADLMAEWAAANKTGVAA